MAAEVDPTPERQRREGEGGGEDAQVRDRIADLLDSGAVRVDAAEDGHRSRHGRSRGHRRHHRHGSHHHRQRLTPRSAALKWWHILLVLVVGLAVTWVVVSIAGGPAGPPPE